MNLPVKLNKKWQIARIVFAEGQDFSFLEKWKKQLNDGRCGQKISLDEIGV
jgi:hypothetical protein